LVKEFIVPLEKQIRSEQEEKQVVEKETKEIVGQKRRARTCTCTSSTSASKEMVAAGGTRRSKLVKVAVKVSVEVSVKVAPACYISSEQEEKQVVEKETQEIVGQKRRARTCTGTSSTSSASKEMVAASGTRRSKRIKVTPAYYVPAEEESSSLEAWSYASSGATRRNTALAALPPLYNNSATDGEIAMNGTSNENANSGSSQRVSAVAATASVNKTRKGHNTFDERFKDLKAFKEEFGHCNVPSTKSKNNKHLSLGNWCHKIRQSYKAIKEGRTPCRKLSKADMKRLENAGFQWDFRRKAYTFDERFKDLTAFKEEFGHCNVPTITSKNNKYSSLGNWCNKIRQSYKAIKEKRSPRRRLSKAEMKRLQNAGFQWDFRRKAYTFDERFNDLTAFKEEFGHCNVPSTTSKNNKHLSLGRWCNKIRQSYKAIKEKRSPICRLSKADIRRLENAGFQWSFF
jgi:hypothetical protein